MKKDIYRVERWTCDPFGHTSKDQKIEHSSCYLSLGTANKIRTEWRLQFPEDKIIIVKLTLEE